MNSARFRFLLVQAFHLPPGSPYRHRPTTGPKQERLMNYEEVSHLLADVQWDLHPGPLAPYGDWPVETREEFALVAAGRLPIIREACQSGRYNAIVLLGGGEPGFVEAREIARPYGIAVTACAFSQMHIASLLGNKFTVIDIAENHNLYYYDLVRRHGFAERCASIRNIDFPLPRPGCQDTSYLHLEKEKARRGEPSEAVERAFREAEAAIQEEGAEVITFGCSASFWLRPFVEKRLLAAGWDVPVLEGYSCAIALAKAMVELGETVSGLMLPGVRPRRWRRRKVF